MSLIIRENTLHEEDAYTNKNNCASVDDLTVTCSSHTMTPDAGICDVMTFRSYRATMS